MKTTRRKGVPPPSSEAAERRMKAQRTKDTAAELAVRSALHRLGLRFRVNRPVVGQRRKADVVFPSERVAVFIDGCFWHGCPLHATWPKANADFWRAKIEANKERDEATDHALRAAGWTSIRIWEHEDTDVAALRILQLIKQRRAELTQLEIDKAEPAPIPWKIESCRALLVLSSRTKKRP